MILARDTVYTTLQNNGFAVTQTDQWSARAERGSKGASIMLGAFAGKKGRHLILDIACATDEQNNLAVTITQGTSGISGGLIGKSQADSAYSDVYQTLHDTFQ
jgi:hypothetical protein